MPGHGVKTWVLEGRCVCNSLLPSMSKHWQATVRVDSSMLPGQANGIRISQINTY
jgi:hypothetical protein